RSMKYRCAQQQVDGTDQPRKYNLRELCPSRGTDGSNPCTLQGGYWLVGIVDWPNRAGLPGVARESCVLSTWNGPAPRQVGRDGSPVGGCASSASTGIDARCGGPDGVMRERAEHGGRD